jgi:hypothetical protein
MDLSRGLGDVYKRQGEARCDDAQNDSICERQSALAYLYPNPQNHQRTVIYFSEDTLFGGV